MPSLPHLKTTLTYRRCSFASMASYTNMTCLIQLNSHCWDCNNNIRASLYRMYGVTSVTFDSYRTVKVTGRVDPRDVLSVVQSYDIHATLLSAKPTYSGYYSDYYQYGYSYANQYCCGSQPMNYHHQQPYWGRNQCQHQPGCNIM